MNKNNGQSKGDCDCCPKTDVEIFLMDRGMMMCSECRDKENSVNAMIKESRAVDSSIQLKTDIFLAHTVPAVELRASIERDEKIAAEEKEYAYAKECMARFKHLQQVIFEERKALLEKENELRMWQVNVQSAAGKLRADKRAEFKEADINYQPAPITKKQKTTKPVTTKKFNKAELYAAAKKYNLPAEAIQAMVVSRNMSPEDAAQAIAKLMA